MDGLDRLVEMLEKRFGKFWADILLLIAVFGAAAWGVHSVVVYLLRPLWKLLSGLFAMMGGTKIHITKDDIITSVAQVFILGVLWLGALAFLRRRQNRWETKARALVDELEQFNEFLIEKKSEALKVHEQAHGYLERAQEAVKKLEIGVKMLDREASQNEASDLSLPPPQDTA